MTPPFLTIYTPTYRRPHALARCKESVAAQGAGVQHLVIEDTVGLGVGGMFAAIPEHHHKVEGEWVFVLSDDDVLPDSGVVAEFRAFVAAHPEADVVMANARIGGGLYPTPGCWNAAPAEGHVTLSNWFVRREVFVAVPYGARYEGDYDHIAEVWRRGYRFAWWPRLVCVAAGWNRGRPEEGA